MEYIPEFPLPLFAEVGVSVFVKLSTPRMKLIILSFSEPDETFSIPFVMLELLVVKSWRVPAMTVYIARLLAVFALNC